MGLFSSFKKIAKGAFRPFRPIYRPIIRKIVLPVIKPALPILSAGIGIALTPFIPPPPPQIQMEPYLPDESGFIEPGAPPFDPNALPVNRKPFIPPIVRKPFIPPIVRKPFIPPVNRTPFIAPPLILDPPKPSNRRPTRPHSRRPPSRGDNITGMEPPPRNIRRDASNDINAPIITIREPVAAPVDYTGPVAAVAILLVIFALVN